MISELSISGVQHSAPTLTADPSTRSLPAQLLHFISLQYIIVLYIILICTYYYTYTLYHIYYLSLSLYTYIYIYMCIHIYIYIYTYIYIYIYICIHRRLPAQLLFSLIPPPGFGGGWCPQRYINPKHKPKPNNCFTDILTRSTNLNRKHNLNKTTKLHSAFRRRRLVPPEILRGI